ncbi:MAG TPA: lmo0937 family membrane protein [Chthoniobacterales bacterium]|nr:lmo0937 family membrane protein [Chthoniobacterales bacterium]
MAARSAITVGRCISLLTNWREQTATAAKNLFENTRACALGHEGRETQPEVVMLWTIFVILLVLWLLGLVSSYTMGGFIHILLVLAIIVLIINLVSGRRGV